MIKEKTKQDMYNDWLEALRSGEYKQTTGALCKLGDDGQKEYCCVGVLDEVVFGTDWYGVEDANLFIDDNGEEGNLDPDTVAPLDLDRSLTQEEVDTLKDYGAELDVSDKRIAALALVNDQGADFDTIAMLIEGFGWND